jgi:hypothetical protein
MGYCDPPALAAFRIIFLPPAGITGISAGPEVYAGYYFANAAWLLAIYPKTPAYFYCAPSFFLLPYCYYCAP